MGADRQEEEVRAAADEMERDADRMDHELDRLGEHIDEAENAADARPEAHRDLIGDVAGDWEDEATGSQQGEDAVDAARDDG